VYTLAHDCYPLAQADVQLLFQEQAREDAAQRLQQAELDLCRAEADERKARQLWAIDAMEQERNRLLYTRHVEQLELDRDESLQRNLLRLEHAALSELERARRLKVWCEQWVSLVAMILVGNIVPRAY